MPKIIVKLSGADVMDVANPSGEVVVEVRQYHRDFQDEPAWADADGPYEIVYFPAGDGPIPGVLWPWSSDGNVEHDWIERDDEADLYPSDDAAARALGEHLGREVKFAWIDSLGRYAPYIDKEE